MSWLLLLLVPIAVVGLIFAFPLPRRAVVTSWVAFRRMGPLFLKRFGLGDQDYTRARAIRLAFEDLGPAYIKFGQMIASSPTAFPKHVTAEFGRCLDEVRPIPPRTVLRVLRRELGRPPEELFDDFDPTPLASASVAQVHTAKLKDGTDVVIKVQRPGIQSRVEHDLGLLAFLGGRAEKRYSELRHANISGIVNDFKKTIREEMNFELETKNIDDFRELLTREGLDEIAHAPEVYHEYSTRRLIVMERLFGCRIDDKTGVDERRDDAVQMLRDTSRVFWTCVFLGGFFHGDIHAGNIMVLDDGRLGYLDFGIFGRFTMNDRIALTEWLGANVLGDGEKLAGAMKRMSAVPPEADWDEFVKDVTEVFLPMREATVDKPEMLEQFFPRLRKVAVKHDLHLPQNFVLILKQVTYFGRYVMIHKPSFNENLDPETQKVFFALFAQFQKLRHEYESANAAA